MTTSPIRLDVEVMVEVPAWRKAVRKPVALCESAVRATVTLALPVSPLADLARASLPLAVCVALDDDESVRTLNREFRGRDAPTNVLAFAALEAADGSVVVPAFDPVPPDAAPPDPAMPEDDGTDDDPVPGEDHELIALGDVVIALETVRDEAVRDGRALAHHLLHMVVHGTLHLLGFDHQDDAEAETMEALETRILATLGVSDPHADPETETMPAAAAAAAAAAAETESKSVSVSNPPSQGAGPGDP